MNEKIGKNTKIVILVICIMLTIVGVTYSFVAPLISGVEDESTIVFNSGTIKISYNGSNTIVADNIIPGWSDTKEFTVVGLNNTIVNDEDLMDYAIKLVVEENTFTDGAIRFDLTGSSTNVNDTLSPLSGKVPTGEGKTIIGTARFSQDDKIKSDVTHSYSLKISFPNDENRSQNEDMNKFFKGYVVIEEGKLQVSLTNYIAKLASTDAGKEYLRYDDTDDNNLRYFGSGTNTDDVPNYVSFNNELWRIIGVFDTYDVDSNETVKAIKLIRNESLGEYSWDTSNSAAKYAGYNFWYYSKLNEELNGDYLNNKLSSNPTWYNGALNSKTAEFNISNVIRDDYQQYIMNARWYLGGWNTFLDSSGSVRNYYKALFMYNVERNGENSTNYCSYNTCSEDDVKTYEYFDGKIGLPYLSDFGYAASSSTSDSSNGNYQNCSENMNDSSYCSQASNWMSKEEKNIWTLTPDNYYVKGDIGGGNLNYLFLWKTFVSRYYVSSAYNVYPSIYLKSDILKVGGSGLSDDPYVIKLNIQ